MLDELIEESKENLLKGLRLAWPSIFGACKKVGSKNPYDDGHDLSNGLYIKFSENLLQSKNIELVVDDLKNTSMYYEERKGKAKPIMVKGNFVNVLQGKIINFKLNNVLSNTIPFEIENLKSTFEKTEKNVKHIINSIGSSEIFIENNSAKPESLKINTFSLQGYLVTAAKNKAKDLYTNKNSWNKMHDDIVIETGEELGDLESTRAPVEEKIVEGIDKRRKMKMINEYMQNEMDPNRREVLEYHLQGVSDKKISELMEISHSNVRKLLFKARIELAKKFGSKN